MQEQKGFCRQRTDQQAIWEEWLEPGSWPFYDLHSQTTLQEIQLLASKLECSPLNTEIYLSKLQISGNVCHSNSKVGLNSCGRICQLYFQVLPYPEPPNFVAPCLRIFPPLIATIMDVAAFRCIQAAEGIWTLPGSVIHLESWTMCKGGHRHFSWATFSLYLVSGTAF